jgi:hypothetical protein
MPARSRRRVLIVVAVLAALALIGIIVAAYQRFEGADVEGKMVAYEVLDDQTVSVTITVTRKNPSTPVVCIVRARSKDGSETGRREVLVGPGDARTVQVTTTVKSYMRPLVGDIYGCGTEVPGYLLRTG